MVEQENNRETKLSNKTLFLYLLFFFIIITSLDINFKHRGLSIAAAENDYCEPWLSSIALASLNDTQNTINSLLFFDQEDHSYRAITEFFRVNNLEELIWMHAVNNQSLLNEAVTNCAHLLEIDLIQGRIAHDANDNSDINIESILTIIENTRQGIKLDFKDIFSLEPILNTLENSHYSGPLIINMDLIPGPGNNRRLNEDQIEAFIEQANRFPNSILSLSWFTSNHIRRSYTPEMIDEMISLVYEHQLDSHPITFPINLHHFLGSEESLTRLLNEFSNSSLTLFLSRPNDNNVEEIAEIITKAPFLGRVMRDY